jgi:hypothetical protein
MFLPMRFGKPQNGIIGEVNTHYDRVFGVGQFFHLLILKVEVGFLGEELISRFVRWFFKAVHLPRILNK